ncbi:MAG: glycosyltransferase 87 family protein [Actinomycetota bacterium]|nr:glycosyltransferase 87 family protein [Actinomycetota bacterium]
MTEDSSRADTRSQADTGLPATRLRATGPASDPAPGADRARPRDLPGWLLIAGAVCFAMSAAALLALIRHHPRFMWGMIDLRVYLLGGSLLRHTGDPYGATFGTSNLQFIYPPIAAGFFGLLSGIKLHYLRMVTEAASIGSLLAVLWLTWGALGYRRSAGRLGATLLVAAVALWTEPVQQTLDFGQVNLVLMLAIVADLTQPDRRWFKGIGVGIAAGIKLTPLVFIPYLLLTRRYRAAAVAAGTFALTIVVSLLAFPKAADRYWLHGLFWNDQHAVNPVYVGNQSLYGAVARILGSATGVQPYWLAAAAVAGAAGLLVAVWASRAGLEMTGILACALTSLLVSPISWSHHWVWIVPALAVLADWAVRRARHRAVRDARPWAGWLGLAAVVALYLAYPRPATQGIGGEQIPGGLIWTLPPRTLQGTGLDGFQQLIGSLYPLLGLAALAGLAIVLRHRARAAAGSLPCPPAADRA